MASTPEEEREEWVRQTQHPSPEHREAMEKKTAIERHVQRANESAELMHREVAEIAAEHPGQVGWMEGESEEK